MKRFVLVVLLISFFSICMPAYAADIPSSWADNGVKEAVSAGMVPQNLQNNWQKNITRAEFCNLIITLLDKRGYDFSKDSGWKSIKFADTSDENIKKARYLNIVDGKKTDSSGIYFYPNDPITRQEAAKMIYAMTLINRPSVIPSATKAQLVPHIFDDRNAPPKKMKNGTEYSYIASWARKCIDFCYNSGIMEGSTNNRFEPNGNLTREQAYITMLKMDRWAADEGKFSKSSDNRYLYYDTKTGLYGYKDLEGNVVIPAKYAIQINDIDNGEFKGGYAVATQMDYTSIIDKNGNTVAQNNKWEGIFDYAIVLSGSRAYVSADNYKTSEIISLPDGKVLEDIYSLGEKGMNGWYRYAVSSIDSKNKTDKISLGFMDQNGNVKVKAQYDNAGEFYNGVATVFKSGETTPCLINESGQVVSSKCGIDFSKYYFSRAWGKYVMVREKHSGHSGVFTLDGKMILPLNYLGIEMTHDGHFIVDYSGSEASYLYDSNGIRKSEKFAAHDWEEVCYGRYAFAFAEGAFVNGDGYERLADENGKKINDAKMSSATGDGGSTILYQIYINPKENDTGLAVPEGVWAVAIDDTGKELWRTGGLSNAQFANGAIRIVRPDGNIEYYTPNGLKLV